MIFQSYVYFGPSDHKVKEHDQCFCDMLLQNAFNLSISNKNQKECRSRFILRVILVKGLDGKYKFIR